jgi:DNA polymerase I-like protein with 3'-5' exonuclease and polymerase domains
MLVFHADEQGEFYFAEMKNRAIQSFATADIVPFAESMLLRLLDPADVIAGKIRPIAVVHDEIVLEVANTYIAKVRVIFKTIQATIVQAFEEHYALETPLNMPLLIEFGTGKTWAEAKAAGKPL